MKWWHSYGTDICYNKRPPVVSWNNLVECMRFRFVPPHFRKDLMLKLQQFQQGTLSVDAYFKELETLLLKVDLRKSEEALIARFVSGLRRDIQDVVELQEYSSLGSLVHLAMKVEGQIAKRNAFKNSPNDGYYNNSWKNRKSFSKTPSKESSFKPKESRPSTSTPKSPIKLSSKKCFKCMGYGHIAANCPSKRNMFVHNGIIISEHDSDSPKHSSHSRSSSEHESESPLEGDLLVVRRLLGQEFHDVFQDPLKGLPPLIGIEHQIDLIPRSSLPNRPAYRTNPSETREIRQQIEDLIVKEFLGFVVSKQGVHVDQSKVVAIQNWPTPTNVNDVRSFHGLASFYRRFVPNFGTIAAALNDIVKKDVVFKWGEAQQKAFDVL
ncbi:uncharacterized protein [Phaseolus vulgaris]|uniref:uncharacterized protein n=1 Tax=Phaseolus vulgaris TaxID=3885 RepID=UPI0035C97CBB